MTAIDFAAFVDELAAVSVPKTSSQVELAKGFEPPTL